MARYSFSYGQQKANVCKAMYHSHKIPCELHVEETILKVMLLKM
jgi:hypothetical protein